MPVRVLVRVLLLVYVGFVVVPKPALRISRLAVLSLRLLDSVSSSSLVRDGFETHPKVIGFPLCSALIRP